MAGLEYTLCRHWNMAQCFRLGLYNHNVDTGIWPNSIYKHACTKLSVKIRALHDLATILTSSGAESKGQKKSNRNEELK